MYFIGFFNLLPSQQPHLSSALTSIFALQLGKQFKRYCSLATLIKFASNIEAANLTLNLTRRAGKKEKKSYPTHTGKTGKET